MLIFPYHLLAEWMCFIAAILLLKNPDPKFGLVIKLYLFSVAAVESICHYVLKSNNQWVYNLDMPVEFAFGIWIIPRAGNFKRAGYITLLCFTVFFLAYLFEWIWHGGISVFFYKVSTIGSVIMIGLCIYYYYTLFHQETSVSLIADPLFLFISGHFIFYTTSMGFDTFFEQLEEVMIKNTVPLGYIIMNIINLILYGFWIASFICLWNKTRSTRLL